MAKKGAVKKNIIFNLKGKIFFSHQDLFEGVEWLSANPKD